ncbi:type VI secretion system baseplate subunit TssE [Pseudomonas vlassakiae]|uniref:Type VI secretion system baseplate subunit TssE n=1 Tax=Pseudomonas vlassakiae TaxID=485888 RepID=A0A923GH66_9PSED|nr:type VI secretion system baseplate subunit TssE [Pseudomonas vlassakiae]MBV4541644.1 type VI secretion system baseplate subunit TssE [Pseudomonas vlassakiae]
MSGLFDRLTARQPTRRALSRREQAGHKFEVIKRHLETLLNARQGCSRSSPELGLRDFNGYDLSTGDRVRQVSDDIRQTLQRFEPRIRICELKAMPDAHAPLELHLRLDCLVQVNDHPELLQVELLVNGLSRYTRVS